MKDILDLIARILIAFIFFYEVYDTVAYWANTKQTLIDYGITWNPGILLAIVVFFLFIGSLMVLIGYYAKTGAFILLVYWLIYTFIVYSFWNDPIELRRLHSLYFMRGMAIAGALLLIMANGAGDLSVKRLIHRLRLPKD